MLRRNVTYRLLSTVAGMGSFARFSTAAAINVHERADLLGKAASLSSTVGNYTKRSRCVNNRKRYIHIVPVPAFSKAHVSASEAPPTARTHAHTFEHGRAHEHEPPRMPAPAITTTKIARARAHDGTHTHTYAHIHLKADTHSQARSDKPKSHPPQIHTRTGPQDTHTHKPHPHVRAMRLTRCGLNGRRRG